MLRFPQKRGDRFATGQVKGAAFWHINADEPSGLDYNTYNQGELYNPDEFRSSDHDPVLIGLRLR